MGAGSYALAVAIAALMVASVGAAHAQTAPFTAETKSPTTTEVTFRTQIAIGTINLSNWAVTDSGHPAESQSLQITEIRPYIGSTTQLSNLAATQAKTLTVGGGIGSNVAAPSSTFLITHAELSSTSAKPVVKFTAGNLDIFDSGTDGTTSPVPTHMTTATDGVAPTISSAEFDGANVILVTLSEHMKGTAATIEGLTYTVTANSEAVTLATADTNADPTLPVDYAEQTVTSTLRIELASAASEGVAHTITLPSGLLDEGDNAFTDSTEDATLPVTAFAAETKSTTTTEVTFDGGSLAGTLDVENWSVTDNDGANADVDLDVTSVAALDGDGNPVASATATDGSTASVAATAAYTKILLTHGALSSTGDTPRVAYSGGDLQEGSSAVAGSPAEAADGIAPSISSAEFDGAGAIVVTLSEHMKGTTAEIEGYTYTVTANGASVGLAAADAQADPAEPVDYAEQAETSTIRLTLAAGATTGLAHTVTLPSALLDAADNAFADNTEDATRTGAFTAVTRSLTTTVVSFGDQYLTGSFNAGHWSLTDNDGAADVALSVTKIDLLDADGDALPPSIGTSYPGGQGAFVPTDDNSMPLAKGILLTHGAISSPADTPRVTYSGAGMGFLGEDLLVGGTAVPNDFVEAADRIAPEIATAAFDGTSAIVVTLSEHLKGTAATIEGLAYTVTANGASVGLAAADAQADPALPVDYAEQAVTSTLRITLAAAAQGGVVHTVTLPEALRDGGDNAFGDRTEGARHGSLFEAQTRSLTTTVVTFSGGLTGSLDHNNWSITDNDGANSDVALEISRVALRNNDGSASVFAFDPGSGVSWNHDGSYMNGYLITHDALDSPGDTPKVTYSGGNLAVGGTAIPDGESDEAADGIAPAFTVAVTPDTRFSRVTVTFSEPVFLAAGKSLPSGMDWLLTRTFAFTTDQGVAVPARVARADVAPAWSPAAPTATTGATSLSFTLPVRTLAVAFSPQSAAAMGSLVDGGENALATGAEARTGPDGTNPTFTARFTTERTIVLEASELLAAHTVTDSSFTVSGVGLASANPVTYETGSTEVTLSLGGDAVPGTEYTITPAATITDTNTPPNAYAAGAITATYSFPAATAVSYAVLDADGDAREAPYASHARAGDTIRLSITLNAAFDPNSPPTALFVGKTADADRVTMTAGAGANEWVASYTVETAEQNAGLADGAFTFAVTATSAAGVGGTLTQASISEPAPPTIDRTPPTFTAKTASSRDVAVTFSEPVSGASLATDWSVGGKGVSVTPLVLTADREVRLRVSEADSFKSGDTPGVTYTMPTRQGAALLRDAAGHAAETQSATPADGVPPAVVGYRFDSDTSILVTFEENLNLSQTALSNSPDLHDDAETYNVVVAVTSRNVIMDAVSGCERCAYSVQYASTTQPLEAGSFYFNLFGIADDHGNRIGHDAEGNSLGEVRLPVRYDTSAPTDPPTVASARTSSATLTVVTLSEDVTGAAAAADWTVAGTIVRGIAPGEASSVTPDADTDDRDTQVAIMSTDKITLLHDAISTDATPSVAYSHTTAGRLAGAQGNVGAGSVTATDGAAPAFAAATATPTTMTITFTEPVTGTTTRSDWGVGGAEPASISETAPDADRTLTLTYAARGTGAAPAVSYGGLSLADAVGNPVAVTSAPHVASSDGVAPSFTAEATNVGRGSVLEVTVTFTEAVSQAEGKTLPTAGDWTVFTNREATPSSVDYDLAADPATATLTLASRDRLASNIALGVSLDVEAAGEEDRQGSIVDAAGNALADGTTYEEADRTVPVMYYATLISGTEVSVTLTEDVSVNFVASDWELDGSTFVGASTNVHEIILEISPPRSTGLPDNAMLTYRGSGSVTDGANNALATGTSVAVTDAAAPTVVSAMSIGSDTVSVVFSEAIGAAPASALTLRNAAGAGAGDVVARGTGTPVIGTPSGAGAIANSQVTFDIVPVAVAPDTEAPESLQEGTYWFHGTKGIRDASDGERRHNPRGTDAGVQLSTSVAPMFTAWFIDPRTIELQPSENLARDTVIADGRFTITAPDDTNSPADDDALPDVIALARTSVDYTIGSVVTIHLQNPALQDVTYTIAPSTSITDADRVPYGGETVTASYGTPFSAEAISRTQTVVTFDDGALSGTLTAFVWRVVEGDAAQPANHRFVSSVAALDSSGNAVPGATSTRTIGDDRRISETPATLEAADGYTQIVITHAPLESTAATPEVTYHSGNLLAGSTRVVGLVPVTGTDGISPEVVSYRLPGPDDGEGLGAHLIVVFSEDMDLPATHHVLPHLYAAPTGGNYISDILGTSFQTLNGHDCNTCVMTVEYAAEPAEGTYYMAITSATDLRGNAYGKDASRQVGEEGRIRIEYDETAPVLGITGFTSTTTIAVPFDDLLSTTPALTAANFVVEVPDDTFSPPDDDTDPDAVALDADTPVTYDAATRTVTLHLAEAAVPEVIHRITPTSVTNAASIAYAGSPALATYQPIFRAEALDGKTTRVTFAAPVEAILNAADWTITDHNAQQPTDRAVSGISGQGGSPAATHQLFSERVIDISHAPIGPGNARLAIAYTVSAEGATQAGVPLRAGGVWEADATYAEPFEAEARSQTETVLTFDGGALSGTLSVIPWRVVEGDAAQASNHRPVTSVAALDASGNPVPGATATFTVAADRRVTDMPVTLAATSGYTQLLLTHVPLESTASTPVVTYHPSGSLLENELNIFGHIDVTAEDKIPPVVVSFSRGDQDRVGIAADITVVFSESMDFAQNIDFAEDRPHLYSEANGGTRVRDAVEYAIGSPASDPDCRTCAVFVEYNARVPDGTYYVEMTAVTDAASNAPAASEDDRVRIVLDRTAPILESAEFSGTRTIAVKFDDGLDVTPPLTGANFAVTAPDDTNLPVDIDFDPDPVAIDAAQPVTYDLSTRIATVNLAAHAVPGVEYTVTPATTVTNEAGLAFAGGSTRATYTPVFSAETIDGDTTVVTFTGDVAATLHAGSWTVTQTVPTREGIVGVSKVVTGISAPGGASAPTLELASARTVELTHETLDSAGPPTVTYTATTGAIDVGEVSIPANAVWHAQATYGEPFVAETRSRTETVLTFDGGFLSGFLNVDDWRMENEGSVLTIASVAALDASGNPVAADTAVPYDPANPDVPPAEIAQGDEYTKLLITHERLDSTAATPTVKLVTSPSVSEGMFHVFSDVEAESSDRIRPEIVSYRRGNIVDSVYCEERAACDPPTVNGFRGQLPEYFSFIPSVVMYFSEDMIHPNGRGADASLYTGSSGTEFWRIGQQSTLGSFGADCDRCAFSIAYGSPPYDNVWYAGLSTLRDRAGNAPDPGPHSVAGRLRLVLDGSAPVLQSAEFNGAYNIAVKFDDGLDNTPPLTENNFTVTAPDDTLLPADPDTDPDVIGFAAGAQVSYDLPSRTATLYLRVAATPGVTYTVTPSSITNEAGLAFGGGSTTAVYTPPFTAETIDGDTTRVTFTGDVTATLSSGQWGVIDNNPPGPLSVSITGISGEGGAPAVTHELSAARTFDITQAALRVGSVPPTIFYVVPEAGLTVGDTALVPGRTWTADATFAAPYEAEARSRTETVLTFDGGDLSGSLITSSWQILEGTEARAIASIAPLDSSGDPVAEKTAVPRPPTSGDAPVSILQHEGYDKLLITHEPVESTAAEFTVTQTFGGVSEGGLYVFEDVPVEADDSIPPEVVSIRRGHQGDPFNCDPEPTCDPPTVYGYRGLSPPYFTFDTSIVIHFSEEMSHYNGRGSNANLYRGDAGTALWTAPQWSTLGPYEADCDRCAWGMRYEKFPIDGVYYAALSTLTDRAGNAPDPGPYSQHGRLRVVLDGSAPVLQSATFTGAKSIAVRFNDGLDHMPPLTASNFAVTTDAGAVALDAENPVTYDLFARTAMLHLAEAVEPGVTHTVTPSSITNEAGRAFAGGSTTASYEPLFTAEALDGDTTRVTFMGDVTATIAAADWAVTDNTGSTATVRAVTGISAQGGTEPSATLALSAGRVIDITHAALGPGREAPTVTYTVPAGGLTAGTTALVAGAEWVTEATLADPFTAETRNRTETVITFDGGSIHGSLATSSWRVQEGTTVRQIVSIAPLDASGIPVAEDTAVPYSGFGPIQTVAVAASDGYSKLLITHASLDSTGSTPTVEHTTGPDLTENSLHIFPRVPVTSADRMAPELESVRHANDREYYPYSRPYVVFNFSEDMALQGAIYPHLYRAETGGAPTHSMVSAYYDPAGRDCNTCSVSIGYSARVDDGSYYAALGSLTDLSGNKHDAASPLENGMVSRVSIVLDPTPPIINLAEFSGTQTIRLDFDDALDVTPALSAANFVVTAPDGTNLPDDANLDPDTIALASTDPVTYDAATTSVTLRLAAGAKDDTPYTITPSSIRNEAGLAYARGAEQATYTPLFSTLLLNQGATEVTFRAPVSGTFATGDWTVKDTDASMTLRAVTGISDGDDAASAMYTLRNTQVLVLDHASLATGESMPAVSYTVPDDSAIMVGALPLAAGGVWTTTAHTAGSSPSLTAPSVTFTTPTLIAARFGEPVELLDVGAFRVNGANHRVETGSAHEIHIRLPAPAQEGVAHTVEIDRDAVRGIAPPNLELARDTVVPGVTYYDPSTFLASTERVGTDTYVKIAFNGRAMGTTSPAEWPITHAPQFDPVPMQQLFTLCGGTMTATASLDVSNVCGDGSPSEFYIPNPHVRSSGEIAFVKYVPRSDQTTVAITVNGQAVGDMFVRATDGTPPLISSATTLDENRVLVRFDEQVRGTPDATLWYHYASAATGDIPPTAAELAAATTAFDSAVLIEEGLAMILTAPGSHAPASGWGSSDTGAVPGAIGLLVPTGEEAGISDMAGNAMASGTARGPVTDGAPPGLATLTARILEDHDDDANTAMVAKTGAFAHVAHAGDAVEVTATFTEAGSTTISPTVQVFGAVLSTALSDDAMGTTGVLPVPDHWATDGLLEYSVSVTDAQGNGAGYTRHDAEIPSNPLRTDVSAPELTRLYPLSPMRLSLTFSEAVTGTGLVTAAAGETVADTDPSAPLVFPSGTSGTQATADFMLTQGMYTFHFADTLTDLGGRTIAPIEIFVPGPPPPAEELMTDRFIPAPPPPPDRMAEERPFDRMIMAPPPPPDRPPELPPPPFRLIADALVDDDPMTDELEARPFGSRLQIGYERTDLTIPEGTVIRHLGEVDAGESPGTILMELAERAADTTYVGMPDASPAEREANERAAQSLQEREPEILVTFGKRDDMQPVLFDQPVRITLFGAAGAEHVFYTTSTQPNPDAPPSRQVSTIPRCEDTGFGSSLVDPPEFPAPIPPVIVDGFVRQPAQGLLECYLLLGQHIVIWTNHFTQFGAADVSRGGSGGDGCDDCTPPTLGVDSTGTRRVSGGFTYNGDTVNAEYYYTPLPLITVETGEENVAAIKVFEDTGTHNLRHVGLSFGLSNGQHFAEAEAAIRVDIAFNGEHSVSLDDPQNAIDADSLSAEVSTTKCMAGSEAECSLVTIRHTFREPLEFNVVSTIVWDDRRNSWQNFFNHGVHVTGESLNPSHGIEVNGGALTLFPLIAGHADDDGDGIFDYDVRHVTYMLDAEYRVYRLTPDGTYQPLRNLASLHHEVDESMWDESLPKKYGPSRASDLFAELIAEERRIAEEVLAAMDIPTEANATAVVPHSYDKAAVEQRAERLRVAIADEVNSAELAMQRLYPEMYVTE